jgi:hypothetical protein
MLTIQLENEAVPAAAASAEAGLKQKAAGKKQPTENDLAAAGS